MSRAQEIWVRNDQGKVWGPLQAATLELMFESGLIPGKVQVSLDGRNFVFAGRLPSVRDAVPRDQWGDVVVEAPAPTGAPIAGPGAVAAAVRAGISVDPPTPDAAPTPPAGPTPPSAPAADTAPVTAVGALPSAGDLEAQSAVALFGLAASSEANALVTLVLRDRSLSIHFRKGNADLVDSNHPDDTLGAFLVRQGLLTADALAKADAAKDRFGGELLPALFGSGALNPGTAFQHLATRAAGLLQQAVAATAGRFTVEAKELPAARAFPLGNRWQPLTDAVRRLAISEVRRRLGPLVDHPVMKSGNQVQVADLRLSPQELRAFGFFDGVRSLAQLAVDLPAEADVMARTAWYLKELGAVSFAAVKVQVKAPAAPVAPAAPAPPPAPPPPAAAAAPVAPAAAAAPAPLDFAALAAAAMAAGASAPQVAVAPPSAPQPLPPPIIGPPPIRPAAAPAGGPVAGPGARPPVVTAAAPVAGPGTRAQVVTSAAPAAKPAAPAAAAAPAAKPDLAAELPALRKIFGALKDQNHFEVLGLTQTADGAQAKTAYFKLARTYHPDTVPGDAPPEYAKLKADIFARIGEAQRTLTDDKLRAEYVELLKSGGADQVDVAKILAAEELFNRATILVKARKFAEAVKVLDEVIAAMPDEGEYYAWRGYAKFFAAVDKRAAHPVAMADINLCLKRNDKVAQAWYFQGHMAKVLNDLSGAKRHFQRCVALNPNHLDAQRELRLMK